MGKLKKTLEKIKSNISVYSPAVFQEHSPFCKYTKCNQECKFCQKHLRGKKSTPKFR